MTQLTVENSLDHVVQDVAKQYDGFLDRLFQKHFAEDEVSAGTRILWSHASRLRNTGAFQSKGIYLWGVEKCPIYIGMTAMQTFEGRFGRYVWQTKSQCNLAGCADVAERGMSAFPPEIHEWNMKNRGRYTPRLRGATRFAREGLDKIWFAPFPMRDAKYIEGLETLLIPIGNEWNLVQDLPALENVAGNNAERPKGKS